MEIPEIKVGQTWKRRDGKLVIIERILNNNGSTPVKAGDDYWMETGRYWSDEVDHKKDLIQLINES